MDAIYISGSSFKVLNDRTGEFNVGRRVKMDCGLDGVKYASVVSSAYSSPYTTVVIDESDLTASLISAWYGVTQTGEIGSFPDHTHEGGVEGQGGTLDGSGLGLTFLSMPDTPATYSGSERLFLRVDATASGVEFAEAATSFLELTDTPTTYSGFEDLYLRVTATGIDFSYLSTSGIDDHPHAAYVPWDFGSGTISGTGDIYCNDIYTSGSTVYIGDLQLTTDDGINLLVNSQPINVEQAFIDLTDTPTDYIGSSGKYLISNGAGIEFSDFTSTDLYNETGIPDNGIGKRNDYSIDVDTNYLYKKDVLNYGSNLATGGTASAEDTLSIYASSRAVDGNTGTYWAGNSGNYYTWWKYNFGSGNEKQINKVRVYAGDSISFDAIQIHGSNNNVDWDFLYSESSLYSPTLIWYDFEFLDNETLHRYIRLNVHPNGGVPKLNEVEMYSLASVQWQKIGDTGTTVEYVDTVSGSLQSEIDTKSTTLLDLTDTPSVYDDGKYLVSTTSGVEWTTISGAGSTTSGTDDHSHVAYVPWDFGSGTISGTGDIYCNDIYTSSGTVYIGDLQLSTDGTNLLIDGGPLYEATGIWHHGDESPHVDIGNQDDYFHQDSTGDIYRKDPGVSFTTWNPADKSTWIDLSNGNLTTTRPTDNSWQAVRSFFSVSSGKWYWEVTIDSAGVLIATTLGVGTSSESLTYPGDSTQGYGYVGSTGAKVHSSNTGFGDPYTAGDIISVALDMDNGMIWWAKNGVWQALGDPANAVLPAYDDLSGKTFYAMIGAYRQGNTATTNFGASAFSYSVPNGFTSGFGDMTGNVWGTVGSVSRDFIALDDTPSTYDAGKFLRSTTSGTEWATVSGGGAPGAAVAFTDHSDTPNTYSGTDGQFLVSTGSGVEFTQLSPAPAEGNWVLVAELDFNNETANESIPWDGDTWPRARIETTTSGSANVLKFRYNNDSGNNYYMGIVYNDGGSPADASAATRDYSTIHGWSSGDDRTASVKDLLILGIMIPTKLHLLI